MAGSYVDKLEPFLQRIEALEIRPTSAVASYKRDLGIKAVLFDIYGTLLISASGDIIQDTYDAGMFQESLRESGFQIHVSSERLMQIHELFEDEIKAGKKTAIKDGIPFPELNIVEIWRKTLLKAEQRDLISFMHDSDVQLFTFLFELKSNKVWPMPNLHETLAEISNRGHPMGIVSNAQFYTPVIMNYFLYNSISDIEFVDGFERDISVFSYKLLRGKPDVFLYEQLLNPLTSRKLIPEEVLFVGNDMLKDMYAAAKTGFKTCFFAGDQRAYRLREDHAEASKLKPDYIITDLIQLLDILK